MRKGWANRGKDYSGADPGFQIRGGILKKIAPSGGRREKFWGFSCEKSRFYAKKIIFFPAIDCRWKSMESWVGVEILVCCSGYYVPIFSKSTKEVFKDHAARSYPNTL
jgi:hypothetical protein